MTALSWRRRRAGALFLALIAATPMLGPAAVAATPAERPVTGQGQSRLFEVFKQICLDTSNLETARERAVRAGFTEVSLPDTDRLSTLASDQVFRIAEGDKILDLLLIARKLDGYEGLGLHDEGCAVWLRGVDTKATALVTAWAGFKPQTGAPNFDGDIDQGYQYRERGSRRRPIPWKLGADPVFDRAMKMGELRIIQVRTWRTNLMGEPEPLIGLIFVRTVRH